MLSTFSRINIKKIDSITHLLATKGFELGQVSTGVCAAGVLLALPHIHVKQDSIPGVSTSPRQNDEAYLATGV